MRFGERLKVARNKKNLTQDNAAIIFKVSRKTISSWENENSYPDINSLIQISNFYHISLDTLLKEDVGMKEFLDKKDVKSGLRPIQICLNILGGVILLTYVLIMTQHIKLNNYGHVLMIIIPAIIIGSFAGVQGSFNRLEIKLGIYKSTWFEKIFTNLKYLIITETIISIILIINVLIFIYSSYDTTPIIEFLFVLIIIILTIFYQIKMSARVKKNKATTKK
ncbi:helix-turn-helix domain-containing protein [Apilactobacillus quenuiae]|uniref:helix-turn-helix domain-containing protein n=1 Tax=Apilactobacillus quenuiae TaxID=2008377 RepID=UPI000D01D3B9|nr:helix-turn-helix transcriptional regulator [Apilactobacillus quenuiae]